MCNKDKDPDVVQKDFLLLYHPIADGIGFWKTQQSRTAYYGLLVLAGIVGIFKLYQGCDALKAHVMSTSILLILVAGVSTILSVYHIVKSESLLLRDRNRLKKVMKCLSDEAQCLVKPHRNYTSWIYDAAFFLPFLLSLMLGFIFVSLYLAEEAGMSWFGPFLRDIFATLIGVIGGILIALPIHQWWTSKKQRKKEK